MKTLKMELIWHNCKTYLPKEEANDDLYLWDGCYVFPVEYYNGHFFDNANQIQMAKPERFWWADLSQTSKVFFSRMSSVGNQGGL